MNMEKNDHLHLARQIGNQTEI